MKRYVIVSSNGMYLHYYNSRPYLSPIKTMAKIYKSKGQALRVAKKHFPNYKTKAIEL